MGSRPAVRVHGAWKHLRLNVSPGRDRLATLGECCRASTAMDKALGEAIRDAVADGHTWEEIGQAVGCSESITAAQVLEDFQTGRQWMWRHFWDIHEE
jgi:hypothetical protein